MSLAKGKLTKTKIKELRKLKKEEWKLALKKPFELSLREHLGKFIDNIKADDVGFFVAWIGVALVLSSADEFVRKVRDYIPIFAAPWEISPWIKIGYEATTGQPLIDTGKKEVDLTTSAKEWIITLAVAYIIVKHFGAIMQTVGDIAKGVKTLGLSLLG